MCFSIGDTRIGGDNSLYKYMTIKTALICFGQGNSSTTSIMFQEPSQWKDKYESRFYCADYSNLSFYSNHPEWVNKVYACCFSTKSQNEAAWKIYGSDTGNEDEKYCVRLKLKRSLLRDYLNDFAHNNNMREYEGKVSYDLSNYIIEHLHQRQLTDLQGKTSINRFYNDYFDSFSLSKYLSLLLIKRKAFSHEEEFRIFLIPDENETSQKNMNKKQIFPKIDWLRIISSIEVDYNTPDRLFSDFVQKCSDMGIDKNIITKYNVYGNNCLIIIEK